MTAMEQIEPTLETVRPGDRLTREYRLTAEAYPDYFDAGAVDWSWLRLDDGRVATPHSVAFEDGNRTFSQRYLSGRKLNAHIEQQVGNPELVALYLRWRDRQHGQALPRAEDFTLDQLAPWAGRLMLLRQLGLAYAGKGTFKTGAAALQDWLKKKDLWTDGMVTVDGSGLSACARSLLDDHVHECLGLLCCQLRQLRLGFGRANLWRSITGPCQKQTGHNQDRE